MAPQPRAWVEWRKRRAQISRADAMAILQAHPAVDIDGLPMLCDGSWPNAMSATVHWRAFAALHQGETDVLSLLIAATLERVLAYRAAIPQHHQVWYPDMASAVPKHWRRDPAVDALARVLEAIEDLEKP